jgi:gliding motility-associated-like protein
MNSFKLLIGLLFLSWFIVAPEAGFAQITSDADQVVPTEYSSGNQDHIHVFCGQKDEKNASLTANSANGEPASFEWQKYNVQSGIFEFRSSDQSGASTSLISNLEDGCYRVKITTTSGETTSTAWVFNNYITATAEIPESDCYSFTLKGAFETPQLIYIDLTNGQPKELSKDIHVKWLQGTSVVSSVISPQIFDPPTKDTDYKFEVADRFGCLGSADVTYISIVTKASFESKNEDQGKYNDQKKPEAPLTVTFTNTSENGDAGKYEWFFFKDLQKINDEKKAGIFKDSIQDIIYSDNPVYTYEATGTYMVKLVSKKISEFSTCTDTFYMKDYIVIDSSFIDAPNVFTPGNGDDVNNTFAINFLSMKSMKVSIFNRWGKVLHVWENNNIAGFSKTITESVWDGKVGGKYASPGVYFYVVEGVGRDGKRRSTSGFVHLFRGK